MKERRQFGAPLAAFQIPQQKLVQMLGNIQAMILVGWRLCKLYEKEKMTLGRVSLGKVGFFIFSFSLGNMDYDHVALIKYLKYFYMFQAWITLKARETVSLGRELLGGNGILTDFLVAKVCILS